MSFHKPLTASPADSETKIDQILWSWLIIQKTYFDFMANLVLLQPSSLKQKKTHFFSFQLDKNKISPKPEKQGANYWQPPARHCTVYYVLKFGTFHRSTLQYPGSARDTPSPFEEKSAFWDCICELSDGIVWAMSHLGICQHLLKQAWTCIILSRQRDEILYQVGALNSLVGAGFF